MPNIIYSLKKRRGIAGKRLGDVSKEETAAIEKRASKPFLPFNEALLAEDPATTRSFEPSHLASAFRKPKSSVKKVTPAVLLDDGWSFGGPQDDSETDEDLLVKINHQQSPQSSQPPTPVRHNLHESSRRKNTDRVVSTDVVPPLAQNSSSTSSSKNTLSTTTPAAPRSSDNTTARSRRRSRKATAAGIQAQKLQFSSAKHPHPADGNYEQLQHEATNNNNISTTTTTPSCARCLEFGNELASLQQTHQRQEDLLKQKSTQHESQVNALTTSYQQELDEQKRQFARELEALKEAHLQERNRAQSREDNLRRQISELQAQHSRELQDLRHSQERKEQDHHQFTQRQEELFRRLADSLPSCPSLQSFEGNMGARHSAIVDLVKADSVRKDVRILDLVASAEKKEQTLRDYREMVRQKEVELAGLKRRLALPGPQYSLGNDDGMGLASGTGAVTGDSESGKRLAASNPQVERDSKRPRRGHNNAFMQRLTSSISATEDSDEKQCADRRTPPFLRKYYAEDPFAFSESSGDEGNEKSCHRLLFPIYEASRAKDPPKEAVVESTAARTPQLKLTKVNGRKAKSKVSRTPQVK